jgi:ABC-2 family transporter protein
MTWVTWRQHRSEAIGALAFVGALALLLLKVSGPMHAQFSQDGLAGCVAAGARSGGCLSEIQSFMNKFGFTFNQLLIALILIPGLIGIIVGAPVLASEFEHGTWRMAWSQTVPRTRWLVTKLVLLTGGLVALGAAMTVVFTWYRGPMDQLAGSLTWAAFDFEGVVLTAYLLCAFAFAVLAGLVIRRSVTAMVAAFIPWLVIRGVVDLELRPHFRQPLTLRLPRSANIRFGPNMVPPMTGHLGDNVLGVTTTASHHLVSYQPADWFWRLQFIEAGLYLALAVAALGAAVWLLHRRAT